MLVSGLTFDLSGPPKAGPLEGRVGRHCGLRRYAVLDERASREARIVSDLSNGKVRSRESYQELRGLELHFGQDEAGQFILEFIDHDEDAFNRFQSVPKLLDSTSWQGCSEESRQNKVSN